MHSRTARLASLAACLALVLVSGCPGQEGGNTEKCGACDQNATCDTAATPPACVCKAGFTGNGASCKPVTCPALTLENGKVTPSGEASLDTTASYSCDAGFKLSAEVMRKCGSDGAWSGDAPTCVAVVDGCKDDPCLHGPCTSTSDAGGYSCGPCEAGWTGANCDAQVSCPDLADPLNGAVTPKSATAGGSATYSCQAGYTLSGEGTRTCQDDGTWTDAAPTCDANPCAPDLAAPANGTVSATTGVTGDVVTYACDAGFTLAGNTTRLCQVDGTWSGADPACSPDQTGCSSNPCAHGTCTPSGATDFTCACETGWTGAACDTAVACAGAVAPAHGSVSAASASFGGTVTYSCDGGYSLAGAATRTCQADGSFSGLAPTCAANACAPDLSAPVNGSVSLTHGATGDLATYACDDGYFLSGSTTRLCQADGSWSGTAPTCGLVQSGCDPSPCQNGASCAASGATGFTCTCTSGWTGATCADAVTCSGAVAPTHGSVSAATAAFGGAVTYSCDLGYTLSGNPTRTCQADGTFDGAAPTCAANPCAPDLSAPANGSVSLAHGLTGDTADYACDPGFALSGTATRLCQADGTWTGAAPTCALLQTGCSPTNPCQNGGTCTASGATGFTCACTTGWTGTICATLVTCSGATAPAHGTVSAALANYGTSITYGCDAGYTLSGSGTRACQADGTFAGLAPTCAANACAPALTAPANGTVSATTGVTGDVVTYGCNGGYSISGAATRTCQATGAWSGSAPTCQLVMTGCSPNPCVHSASCTPVGATGYSCGTCDAGWTGANCDQPVTCSGAVAPANGSVSAASATFGQSVTYACDAGYTLSGSATRLCQASGAFAGTAPTCAPVNCGAAPSVPFAGSPTVSGGAGGGATTTFGATAAYACTTGYTKAGADATCRANGTWSAAPTCTAIDCGAAPMVLNAGSPTIAGGVSGGTSTTFGATAAYACDAGYAKSGSNAVCGSSGWSAPPTCGVVDCGATPAVLNAGAPVVSGGLGGGATTTYSATAAYTCNTGFTKAGSNPVCGTGGWSAAPTCSPTSCGTPPAVTNAGSPVVSGGNGGGTTPTYGATAAYTCITNYAKAGANPVCGATGSWGAAPTCSPVSCGTPPVVANAGSPTVSGGLGGGTSPTVGATAAYACDPGYQLVGANPTCGTGGAWSAAPTCNVIDCGATPSVANAGAPTVSGGLGGGATTTYNATAAYTCNTGFTKAGSNAVCGAGGWSTAPTCTPVDCGAPPAVTNAGTPVVSGGAGGGTSTTFGATATFTCIANYAMTGTNPVCGPTGSWSATPTCNPVNCGTPPVVANAGAPMVSGGLGGGTTPTVGATAAYTCNSGFTVKVGADPVCAPSGAWGSAPTCNPVNCGTPPTVANAGAPVVNGGAGGAGTNTYPAIAAYTCNSGYAKGGSDPNCQATGAWSAAPTCTASSCGTYTDVVYRLVGQFRVGNSFGGAGDKAYPGLGANTTSPIFSGAGNTTPFVHTGTYTNGFARLRYTNDAAGNPANGAVRLVELYFPLNYLQDKGATITIDTDYSVNLISPALSNCGSGDTACTNHAPAIVRSCTGADLAQGTLGGTTTLSVAWGACTATSGSTGWDYVDARGATGVGCAKNWNAWGHAGPCTAGACGSVPACSLGDSYQTWNQQLKTLTLSGTNPKTATFTMPEIQLPNCTTGFFTSTTTWLSVTSATPIATQCGSTPGTDLVCNVQ